MSEQKHTPGPWRWVYDGSSDYSIGEADDPQAKPVAGVYDRNHKRAAANCDLIAAAPDLLEACKDLVDRFERKATSKASLSCSYAEAKRAIAKAEGR